MDGLSIDAVRLSRYFLDQPACYEKVSGRSFADVHDAMFPLKMFQAWVQLSPQKANLGFHHRYGTQERMSFVGPK